MPIVAMGFTWRSWAAVGAATALLVPGAARAHVKWFAPFDLTAAPTGPGMFISQEAWLLGLALSVPAVWLAVAIDQLGLHWRVGAAVAHALSRAALHADDIVRVTIGVWLTWLWTLPTSVFLTPELIAPSSFIHWIQLFLSVFCFSRSTAWITGLGLLALYLTAMWHYGAFHLADYPLFVGIAAYLIGISAAHCNRPKLRGLAQHRHAALIIAMATTLCWASIEKWAYAHWSWPILREHSYLALGLDPATFMALAGWVEFGLAISLIIGGRLTSRLAALVLLAMFSAAVFEFGKVDLIGHLPIIASLFVVVTKGNGVVGERASLARRPVLFRLAALPLAYYAFLALTMTAYFGGWHVA